MPQAGYNRQSRPAFHQKDPQDFDRNSMPLLKTRGDQESRVMCGPPQPYKSDLNSGNHPWVEPLAYQGKWPGVNPFTAERQFLIIHPVLPEVSRLPQVAPLRKHFIKTA